VVNDALGGVYGNLFASVCNGATIEAQYDCIAESIAAFERTALFGQFTSKYDHYLQACLVAGGAPADCAMGIGKVAEKAGKTIFSKEEWAGFQLFMGENNNDGILDKGEGAACVLCHVADWTAAADYELSVVEPQWTGGTAAQGMIPPQFTDFTYDNLGVPQNTEYPLDPDANPDLGLGPIVGDSAENGKFKVMTLRNIGLTMPYAHNGLFKSLKEITHFYNTRDVLPLCEVTKNPKPGKNCWHGEAEVPETVNFDELGNLGLSDADEDAIVEFMKTLDDGWTP
jgi:cytochrome c peroxidase